MNKVSLKSESIWLEFSRRSMACQFEILLHPERPSNGPDAALEALDLITYLEQTLSVYIPTSDLSRLNARAHEVDVQVALPTIELLEIGMEIHRLTGGAFDMTAAKLSDTWGFSSRQGRMPNQDEISSALAHIGMQHINVDRDNQTVRYAGDIKVNPGGIGKGYALDQACELLRSRGVEDFAIHGGKSSIRVSGKQEIGKTDVGWKVAVRHPEQSERILGTLILRDRALGTSGPANQFFYFRGERFGHIIDPRTGWPSRGMLSVTVLHESACWADALATGLYVLGLDQAIEFCRSRPGLGMIAIMPSQREGEIEVVTCNVDEQTWQPAQSKSPL